MTAAPSTATVFVVARPGTDAAPLAQALTSAGATVAALTGSSPSDPETGAPSLDALAASMPGARFVFVALTTDDPVPAEFDPLDGQLWTRVDRDALLAGPRAELQRICAFLGLVYDQALLSPVEHAARAARERTADVTSSPFASVSTDSFAELIALSGGSLLVSTYQTNRLVVVRARENELNTHFRGYEKPMGIAVARGRIALGTRTEVWDLRDVPAAAGKVDPPGTHDACYIPRNRHVTADIAVHDLAFAGGDLWIVATAFSCLATLDADHSFVPRWTPSWITQLVPEDRCHLNGLAVIEDRVAFVTALGTGNETGSWRARKASDGVLIEVASGQVAVAGLSMPHSPRWYDGRLWLLESGRGRLVVCDPANARVETVAELPGFTRGLTFVGPYALVGLSQIRESSTFGNLPITRRLSERRSGVWIVDLRTGQVPGFLRFDDLVQEIFDVALLPGARWPEIAEAGDERTGITYVLPD